MLLTVLSIPLLAQPVPDSLSDAAENATHATMLGTYYSDIFVGRRTSTGEIFRQNQYTAAHKTYPFGTYLLVTYPVTNQSVVVRINDRCPKNNILDMSKIAVHAIGIKGSGKVTVTTLDPSVGYMLWVNQDTLAMTTAEYMAYRDKCKHKRVSPYPHATKDAAEEPSPPVQVAQRSPTPPAKPKPPKAAAPPAEKPVPTAETTPPAVPPETEAVPPPEPAPVGPLYDLELCTVGSQFSARLECNRLPKEMQPKVFLESKKQSKEIRIILVLSESRSHAVRTQAELIDLFPESCLIPHEK